jgi:histidinol dehydrogenase
LVLTTIDLRGKTGDLSSFLPAPSAPGTNVAGPVAEIIDEVRRRGDAALFELTERFDGVKLEALRVPDTAIHDALDRTPAPVRRALEEAYDRIVAYHAHEMVDPEPFVDGDIVVRPQIVPVDRAGAYAPGGRAIYPSSVLMCVGPARVAGVEDIVLCAPPNASGCVDDATLAAASVAGVREIYSVGGAQAIAAMAIGTETIERVDVIVGPGNAYVAEAKRQVSGLVGIASAFAGPSEIVVIADATTPPALAAVDLMVQAEHGPDGLAWLITWDEATARAIEASLVAQISASPRRSDLESTMATSGVCVLVDDPTMAAAISNVVAPEHLELLIDDYATLVPQIRAAGAVFCGQNAPASLGDYAVGPNHVLPTNRSARFSSALRADDFRRHIHVVEVGSEGFDRLKGTVMTIAEVEGLPAHVDSVRQRDVGR